MAEEKTYTRDCHNIVQNVAVYNCTARRCTWVARKKYSEDGLRIQRLEQNATN